MYNYICRVYYVCGMCVIYIYFFHFFFFCFRLFLYQARRWLRERNDNNTRFRLRNSHSKSANCAFGTNKNYYWYGAKNTKERDGRKSVCTHCMYRSLKSILLSYACTRLTSIALALYLNRRNFIRYYVQALQHRRILMQVSFVFSYPLSTQWFNTLQILLWQDMFAREIILFFSFLRYAWIFSIDYKTFSSHSTRSRETERKSLLIEGNFFPDELAICLCFESFTVPAPVRQDASNGS